MSLSFPYRAALGGLELSADTVGSAVSMVLATTKGAFEPDPDFGVPTAPFYTLSSLPAYLRDIEAAIRPYCPIRPSVSGTLGDDGVLTVEVEINDLTILRTYE